MIFLWFASTRQLTTLQSTRLQGRDVLPLDRAPLETTPYNPLVNSSTHQLVNLSTCQPVNLSTRQLPLDLAKVKLLIKGWKSIQVWVRNSMVNISKNCYILHLQYRHVSTGIYGGSQNFILICGNERAWNHNETRLSETVFLLLTHLSFAWQVVLCENWRSQERDFILRSSCQPAFDSWNRCRPCTDET